MGKLPKVTFETLQAMDIEIGKKIKKGDLMADMSKKIEKFAQEQPFLFFYVSQVLENILFLPIAATMYEMLCTQIEVEELNKIEKRQIKGGDKS